MPSLQRRRMQRSIMSTLCGHMYILSYISRIREMPLTFKKSAGIVSYTRQLFSKVYYNTVDNFWIISEVQFSL